jgi:microcystin-dependent protein
MAVFCPLSTQPVFFQGAAQIGAEITVYDAGTLTPRTAYRDGLLNAPFAQPILTDANGCLPEIWVAGNAYKLRIVTASGVQIREVDNLPGDMTPGATGVANGAGGGGGSSGAALLTGDLQWNYGTAVIAGRVRANGNSIGNAVSGASELANPVCQGLFQWLWNGDPTLAVSGGRGATALADWNANKTIALPDFRGRTPFGIDGMGAPASGRLANASFATGNAGALGSSGGTAAETLTSAQIASHVHTGTTQANAAFSLTGTTAQAGAFAPSATSDVQGAHSHGGASGLAGDHTHGASADTQGAHAHGGSVTDTQGAHAHTFTGPATVAALGGTQASGWWFNTTTAATSTAGAHSHNLEINTDGAHSHNITVAAVGNHQHAISSDGAHAHAITVSAIPSHAHSFVTDAGGVHTHSFTSDATGGGGTHNNLPPFLLVTFYLVL